MEEHTTEITMTRGTDEVTYCVMSDHAPTDKDLMHFRLDTYAILELNTEDSLHGLSQEEHDLLNQYKAHRETLGLKIVCIK